MAPIRRALVSWLLLAAATASAAAEPPLRHVAKGATSEASPSNSFLVIRNADDLAAALNQTANRAAGQSPGDVQVDFDKEMIVAVMLSNRPQGCAGVDIASIAQDGIVSVVHYREPKPRKGETCHGTSWSPFDLVAVPKSNAPFRFTLDAD
jgi:hypothetical protein